MYKVCTIDQLFLTSIDVLPSVTLTGSDHVLRLFSQLVVLLLHAPIKSRRLGKGLPGLPGTSLASGTKRRRAQNGHIRR